MARSHGHLASPPQVSWPAPCRWLLGRGAPNDSPAQWPRRGGELKRIDEGGMFKQTEESVNKHVNKQATSVSFFFGGGK